MSLLDGCDMEELLRESRLGFWKIEFEEKEGVTPRFYADSVTDELMGISADMTPEERFLFHRAHIHQDDMEMFLEYSDKLSEERTEIVYRYIHPISGEMYVRCSGKKRFCGKRQSLYYRIPSGYFPDCPDGKRKDGRETAGRTELYAA